MTDKVQKIKDWISKEQDGLMDDQGNFEYPEHEGAYHILCNLDAYIDSMQEEHKFKTGDRIKPIDSCLGSPRTIVDVCDSWYVTDQGTLDFEYEDNWELAEEPVNEDLKEFEVEYIEREKDNIVCVYDRHAGLVDGAKWQKQQMMKDAIEAEIINWASMFTSIKVLEPERAETMIKEKFDIGDKVKLIIVKED